MNIENKCPLCDSVITTFQVETIGSCGSGECHVGCGSREGTCLLSNKSWTMKQWSELCSIVNSAGEGYPGAAHDAMERESMLRCLINTWTIRANFLSDIVPGDGSAARVLGLCIKELSEEINRT